MNPRNRFALLLAGTLAAAALIVAVLYGKWGIAVHEAPEMAADVTGPSAPEAAGRANGLPESLAGVEMTEGSPPAPDAVFFDADGANASLADFRDRFVVLNLWATWCAPCVAELPALARAQESLREDGVLILPVDMEKKSAEEISAFLSDNGAGSLPTYIDRDYALMQAFEAFTVGLPYTIFIDTEGRQIASASGPQEWDDAEAIAYIRQMAMGG
jgi:thiol-disulfide isomerase/thioredoxin